MGNLIVNQLGDHWLSSGRRDSIEAVEPTFDLTLRPPFAIRDDNNTLDEP
jgi:hypothetical protein